MLIKKTLVVVLLFALSSPLHAEAPVPPLGKRWVLNPEFSDEFNGTELDKTKWLDHHPTWKGRVPGIFLPSQVSVKEGCLQIKGEKLEKEIIVEKRNGQNDVFTIAGGAVVSKKEVYLGYFECRAKAAATTMSTTFWFSGGGGVGPLGCDRYSQEWDIQECIGRNGDFDGSYFGNGMHSNAHYWYTDCDGKRHDHRAPQVKFEETELASENFHVYGGWWRDETSASYYYDNGEPKHQTFYNEISDKPFDKPMTMRLVSESYPFPWIELPSDEELADPTKNVAYYDWVRSYQLVDADDPNHQQADEQEKPQPVINLYDEGIAFNETECKREPSGTLKVILTYKANEDRQIVLKLLAHDGKTIADTTIIAYAGHAHLAVELPVEEKLANTTGHKLVGILRSSNSNPTKDLSTDAMEIDLSISVSPVNPEAKD